MIGWLWMFTRYLPKPPGKGGTVLLVFLGKCDRQSGCAWITDHELAELAGSKDPRTASAALAWAARRGLARRLVRGHNLPGVDSGATKSLWALADPAVSRATDSATSIPVQVADSPADAATSIPMQVAQPASPCAATSIPMRPIPNPGKPDPDPWATP